MLYLGADHRGFQLKEEIKDFLKEIPFKDLGNLEYDQADDFPVFAELVARQVIKSDENRGIIICGSGVGMSIAANRIKKARAGLCLNPEMAKAAREEDDINILVLPAEYIPSSLSKEIIEVFLKTDFKEKERYLRRRKMIDDI